MTTLTTKSKLTLWLDRDAIILGKTEARRQQKSLSAMFIDFIQNLHKTKRSLGLSPRLKRLKGALKSKTSGLEDYHHYLEKKYLSRG